MTPYGKFQFRRVPFGFRNSSFALARYLTTLLGDLQLRGVTIYYDDILIFTSSVHEMHGLLEEVLERLDKGAMSLNAQKCKLYWSKIDYLGYQISEQGLKVLDKHINAIDRLKIPTCKRDVKSLLAALEFISKHLPNFARVKKPLNDILSKNVPFVWTEECMQAWVHHEAESRISDNPHPVRGGHGGC